MKGLKQRLKRPTVQGSVTSQTKDASPSWTHQDQRVWQSVASNQPTKVAAKLAKHPDVDVNKLSPSVGYSVVHFAAAKGLDDCLNILLAHHADASSCDITGATPLHAAARYGHRGTTSKLLASRSVRVNMSDKNQCTPLHFAAFEGHVDCVTMIADAPGTELHCTDKDGRTPLMVSAAMGRLEVCKELLKRGCSVDYRDKTLGHTALTLAADSGHAEVVRLLCEYGAQPSVTLNNGQTALNLAKNRDRRSVIDVLHVMQLTEAAKKGPNGPRLSVGRYKSEDSSQKKRRSVDSLLDKQPQAFIDDLVVGTHAGGSKTPKAQRHTKEEKKYSKSNIAKVKAAVESKMKTNSRRGSNASGLSGVSTPKQRIKKESAQQRQSPSSNRLSLYNEENNSHFYDKEMKFMDTSLSNSSLDVSSTCSAAHNNLTKSMDSLKPTPEELEGPVWAPNTEGGVEVKQSKTSAVDSSQQTNGTVETEKMAKASAEYENIIRDLQSRLARADEDARSREKLQKNTEEIRAAQIHAEKQATEKLASQLQKRSRELEQTKVQKEELERRTLLLQQRMEEMRQTINDHEDAKKDMHDQLQAAQLAVMTTKDMQEQSSKLDDLVKKLEVENSDLQKKIKVVEEENKKVQEEIVQGKKHESEIINSAKQKVIEAEQRCNQAEQKLNEEQSSSQEKQHSLVEARNKINQLEQEISESRENEKAADRKLVEAEHQNNEDEKKMTELSKKCKMNEKNMEEMEAEKQELEEKIQELIRCSKRDRGELEEVNEEIAEMWRIVRAAKGKEEKKSEADVIELKSELQSLVESLKVGEEQSSSIEEGKRLLEEKFNNNLEEKNKRIAELESQIQNVEKKLVKKTEEADRLDEDLQIAESRLTEVESSRHELEKGLKTEIEDIRAKLAEANEVKVAQADQFSRSCDEVNDLRKQRDEALDSLQHIRDNSVSQELHKSECERLMEDCNSLRSELAEAFTKYEQVQLEMTSKEQEISNLRVERNQSEARSSENEAEVVTLRAKVHESDVQVNILRQQLTDAKHKAEKAAEESENLRRSRRELSFRLTAKQEEMSEAEQRKVEKLRLQVENLGRHLQDSDRRYKDTIAIYRGHLLAAVKGELDPEVLSALQEILKLRVKEEEKGQGSTVI